MFGLTKKDIVNRDFVVYRMAKGISNIGYRLFSKTIVDIPYDLNRYKKEQAVFLYTGLHKSLWETTGVLSCIDFHKWPIPFTGMGDNLIRGDFFQKLSKKAGIFLVKRGKTRRDMLASSKKLKQYVTYYIAKGIDVTIFPEGTRRNVPDRGEYGSFFATAFDAVLEYEKNKDKFLAEYPELSPRHAHIIPFNVDYSLVREDFEMVGEADARPRTLKVFDFLKMVKHVGNVYISFAEPIKLADHLDKRRKELAEYARGKCLDLVKILPINVAGRALAAACEQGDLSMPAVHDSIRKTIDGLMPHKERFREFSADDPPQTILDRVAYHKKFQTINSSHISYYRLYAGYIHHL